MENHFTAHMHGAKQVGGFCKPFAGNFPEEARVFFGRSFLSSYIARCQSQYERNQEEVTIFSHAKILIGLQGKDA